MLARESVQEDFERELRFHVRIRAVERTCGSA
jgi:hypothetical protein